MDMKGIQENIGTVPDRSDTCAICQRQIESTQQTLVHEASCNTPFHKRCLKDHLARSGSCPICRGEICKTVNDETRWQLFLEWHSKHDAIEKNALSEGTIPTLYKTPGWKVQGEFASACIECKVFVEGCNRRILDVHNHKILRIEDAKALVAKESTYDLYARLGDLCVQMCRRNMAGEDAEALLEAERIRRREIMDEADEEGKKRLRDLRQERTEIEHDTIGALEKSKEQFRETVGYHWEVMQLDRDKCSRADDWEDIPYPVS